MSDFRQPLFLIHGEGLLETDGRMVALDDESGRTRCQISGCAQEGSHPIELHATADGDDDGGIVVLLCQLHCTFLCQLAEAREYADSIREERRDRMN